MRNPGSAADFLIKVEPSYRDGQEENCVDSYCSMLAELVLFKIVYISDPELGVRQSSSG